MKTYNEINLSSFDFWSGAKDNAAKLTSEQLDEVELNLEELYPDGMSETQLNDIFWFDFATVLDWLGLEECDQCGEIHERGELCKCEQRDTEE